MEGLGSAFPRSHRKASGTVSFISTAYHQPRKSLSSMQKLNPNLKPEGILKIKICGSAMETKTTSCLHYRVMHPILDSFG